MLKRFFFNAVSSFVGAWVALALFGVAVLFVIIGLAARIGISEASAPSLKGNSIFRLELSGAIEETEVARKFNPREMIMNPEVERPASLNMLVTSLGEAKVNKNVKALYIRCDGVVASPATLHALRLAVADFKQSGKKVYAYGDQLTQPDYYVASLADSIFLNPAGSLDLHGIGGISLYLKDLFDKLGVKFTVCKVGTFKSAVEPFISNEMSGPARAQLDTLYGNMWRFISGEIETSRKLPRGAVDSIMAAGITMLRPCDDMVKAGFVDRLVYGREMKQILGRVAGQDPEKLNFISPSDLTMQTNWGQAYTSKKQVAVLYATGEIAEGGNGIDCEKLVPEIVKLADDKNVKALVLRVNSPGGSVFGSDQIGEALGYFKSKGKPFVVSMGDYAASGGYWISCEGERIFADPMTITGSIGIFGLMPNISGLMAKVGVSPQTVATNPGSMLEPLMVPLTDKQTAEMQSYVERGYRQFTERVANGRGLPLAEVLRIAEGRVWDGESALKLKLVDQLGTLGDAISYAAGKASLADNYDVAVYPRFEPSFWDMVSLGTQLGVGEALDNYLENVGADRRLMEKGIQVLRRKPLQALAPEVDIFL